MLGVSAGEATSTAKNVIEAAVPGSRSWEVPLTAIGGLEKNCARCHVLGPVGESPHIRRDFTGPRFPQPQ